MIRKDFEVKDLDFGKNPDGLIPVVVQDYATLKVLMLENPQVPVDQRRNQREFSYGQGDVCRL